MPTNNHIHILGCGDIGRRVAQLCLHLNLSPNAWVKTSDSAKKCQQMGLRTHQLDFDDHDKALELSGEALVLYTAPPPSSGRTDARLHSVLKRLNPEQVSKFVLISTSGVYGDCGGRWIDESTPIHPVAERAIRRVDAEQRLQSWALKHNIDIVILRVPGIYAADRLPIERIKRGLRLVRKSESPWTNRIHADDLASACVAALNKQLANEIINIVDDQPSTMFDYFKAAADYTGLPRPEAICMEEAKLSMSNGMKSYLAESRRIKNDKMKYLLEIDLRYPSLKEGLPIA